MHITNRHASLGRPGTGIERPLKMNRRNATLVVALIATNMCFACASMVDSFTGEDVAREIREKGLPAKATVLKIWETGVRVNDNPVVGFLLEIHAKEMAPYEAETKALISILWITQIQPGAVLPVKYDPENPSRIALDIFEE